MDIVKDGVQFMFQALRTDPDLDGHLTRLRIAVPLSWELVQRSECWRSKYKIIDDLLPQLKDAAYDAQTVLHKFAYQELKQYIEGRNQSVPREFISSALANLRNWIKGSATKVKEIRERLDDVYINLRETCDRHRIPENPNQFSKTARPATSSFVTEPKIFGRDKDLKKVIRLLGVSSRGSSNTFASRKRPRIEEGIDLPESSGVDKKENVYVLPIVGIGGVGKTTLAQMVCSNKNVQSHFKLIMWVCVSDNFDVTRLTKEIIECATDKACDVDNNLNSLQLKLKEILQSKRFLLVLDDVWSENRSDWDRLFGPLKEGCEGSMVIMTTRSQKVAKITGKVMKRPIILEGLDPDVYWEFFQSCVLGPDANLEKYPELKKIGEQIIIKLKGSPLAANTLGGLLFTELSETHWRNIRDSEIWELQQEEHGILPVLQLSYQYLPSYLKKCFSFCSLFPKDYKFHEDELTWFWIGEGFMGSQQIRQIEVVAKGYFHELVNRNFFQKAKHNGNKYVIHDLMHDVAQSVTVDECFRTENEASEKKKSKDIRHLSVFYDEVKMVKLKEIHKYRKLYTLKIHKSNICDEAINCWFNEVTNICSLSITSCTVKDLPDNIGNLKHLRYLDISGTKIEQLPDSFCNLYKLEFLYMRCCKRFRCFPDGSNRLISLKLLMLPLCRNHNRHDLVKVSLVGHIPNLANAIQEDKLIFLVTKRKNNTIGTLKHINRINKLEICQLGNVSTKAEAEQAELNKKEFVNNLRLSWHESTNNDFEAVLEGLCPHPNLQNLRIEHYGGEILNPSWLKTETSTNLTSITICGCGNITTIPCLPRSITELEVEFCSMLTSLEDCLVPSNLPSLEKIKISYCYELVSMSLEALNEFKHLQQLCIIDCPKLTCERDMVLPPPLQGLWLDRCGEVDDRISSSLPNLTSLAILYIANCQRVTSIPLHNLKSLEYLYVRECSELQSIGGRELLASVKNIRIWSCPQLEETNRENYRKGMLQRA